MTFNELRNIRSPRGKAKLKSELLEEISNLECLSWHYTILAVDNELSTYDGLYPETVGVARDNNLARLQERKKNFIKEMQK